jgi:Na+-transporting NADH:ubiquinone oxidoreductase subunit NqrB
MRAINKAFDPRIFQILFQAILLGIGVLYRDFSLQIAQVCLTFTSALLTQSYWLQRLDLQRKGYLSAIITSFGLSLLVRADNLWVHPFVACVSISSKFLCRLDDRHIFNPANFGAILALWVLPGAWLSPGQWGQDILLAAWFIALGGFVSQRAQRWDISWIFLLSYFALVSLRIHILGQSWSILEHQLQNGALLLFAFFMISDPMTTPQHRIARIIYGLLVALLAFTWQYFLFKPNGPVVALFICTPLVLILNRWWQSHQYQWVKPTFDSAEFNKAH